MRRKWNIGLGAATFAAFLIGIVAAAQGSQYGQAGQSQPPAQQTGQED